ncbi:hypothetical protein D3C71_1500360 [compost metagenome]
MRRLRFFPLFGMRHADLFDFAGERILEADDLIVDRAYFGREPCNLSLRNLCRRASLRLYPMLRTLETRSYFRRLGIVNRERRFGDLDGQLCIFECTGDHRHACLQRLQMRPGSADASLSLFHQPLRRFVIYPFGRRDDRGT